MGRTSHIGKSRLRRFFKPAASLPAKGVTFAGAACWMNGGR